MIIKSYGKSKGENNKSYVYKILKDNIIELYLKPGEKINEVEVAEQLEVSRTPIRETFTKLEAENLITVRPKRGTYVSLINYSLAEAAIYMKILAEKEVLRQSCLEFSSTALSKLENILEIQKDIVIENKNISNFYMLDREFHKNIFIECGRENVWNILEEMNIHFSRLRKLRLHDGLDASKIFEEHKCIVEAIKDSDTEKMEGIILEHFKNLKESLNIYHEKFPHFFEQVIK